MIPCGASLLSHTVVQIILSAYCRTWARAIHEIGRALFLQGSQRDRGHKQPIIPDPKKRLHHTEPQSLVSFSLRTRICNRPYGSWSATYHVAAHPLRSLPRCPSQMLWHNKEKTSRRPFSITSPRQTSDALLKVLSLVACVVYCMCFAQLG